MRAVEIPQEKMSFELSADVALPQGQLILAARDDTAEYDDHDANAGYKDDPQLVFILNYLNFFFRIIKNIFKLIKVIIIL